MNPIAWLLRNWAPVGLLGFAVGIFYVTRLDKTMHERAKFTLGTVAGWHYTAKSGRVFNFDFAVAGVRYGGASGWHAGMDEANGARCLVEYDSLDPEMNAGHFAIPIPDSIRRPPVNGWRVPPFPVPAWIIDHGKEVK